MLTFSPLPGPPGLLDLPPVKAKGNGDGGGFAPLIARLLSAKIGTYSISLPPGGEILPVTVSTVLPADVPTEPPSILIAAASPTPTRPDVSSDTPSTRFIPIIMPATPPVPPMTAPVDGPRLSSGVRRTALLTSVAATLTNDRNPATASPTPIVPPTPPGPEERHVPPAASGRKLATTAPVTDEDEEPGRRKGAGLEIPPVPVDLAITPDAATIAVAPVGAPPSADGAVPVPVPVPVDNAPATPATPRPPIDLTERPPMGVRPMKAGPAPDVAGHPGVPVTTVRVTPVAYAAIVDPAAGDIAPRRVRSTKVVDTSSAALSPLPSSTAEENSGAAFVRLRSTPEPAPRAPVAIDARATATDAPAAARSIDLPVARVVTDYPHVITLSPGADRHAFAAFVVADAPAQLIGFKPKDVMTPTHGRFSDESVATTPPSRPTISPVTAAAPVAGTPVILPALQAFGAAIRRAMADERKAIPAHDDTGLGLTPPAGATAPAATQTMAASDTTLDTADHRWPHAMAEQIEKLRDAADAQSTRIRLLPDALGPVDVAVRRDGDQVHVHFAAADAQTRQLLADAQPRLTEAAEARGLKLGRTDVSSGDPSTGNRQHQQRQSVPAPQSSRPGPARSRGAPTGESDTRIA